MNELLEAALERARAGAHVLPLWWTDADGTCACPKRSNCEHPGKHPRTKHGLNDASGDPNTIQQWWRRSPRANLGIRADDQPRIDIDLVEVADALLADSELVVLTEVIRTQRGGLHITFNSAGIRTSTLKLADGRALGDLKAVGGYVVAPPSRVGQRRYQLLSPAHIKPLTVADPVEWLRSRLAACGYDLAVGREEPAYRDATATVGVGGRHQAVTSHAGLFWVEGIAPDAFAAAVHAVNEAICSPPLTRTEVDDIVRYFIARAAPRVSAANADSAPPQRSTAIQSLDDWLDGEDPPLDVVLGDGKDGAILPIDGKGLIAGGTGIGKTNLLLRLGRSLCEGTPFLGRFPVPEPRTVLHVALEGSRRGLRRRLRKVWADAPPEARSRYFLVFMQLNLGTPEDVIELERLILKARAAVVILDPLRNAHTWDENDSRDTALLTSTVDGIIARYNCAIIAAHHDRKKPPLTKRDSGTDRIRGSTALAGWLSFCLSVEKDKTPDTLIAEWTKVRDAEEGLTELTLTFDRETLDFDATERTAVSKVSDDDVLTPVFHAGQDGMRGSVLVERVRLATGAGERTVKDRIRELAKSGQLIEFIADEDRAKRAKSYRLPEVEE